MKRTKFDYLSEIINKVKEYWLKDIKDADLAVQYEWLKSFREELDILFYDCEDADDKEFIYKYIKFVNQLIEKVLED